MKPQIQAIQYLKNNMEIFIDSPDSEFEKISSAS